MRATKEGTKGAAKWTALTEGEKHSFEKGRSIYQLGDIRIENHTRRNLTTGTTGIASGSVLIKDWQVKGKVNGEDISRRRFRTLGKAKAYVASFTE